VAGTSGPLHGRGRSPPGVLGLLRCWRQRWPRMSSAVAARDLAVAMYFAAQLCARDEVAGILAIIRASLSGGCEGIVWFPGDSRTCHVGKAAALRMLGGHLCNGHPLCEPCTPPLWALLPALLATVCPSLLGCERALSRGALPGLAVASVTWALGRTQAWPRCRDVAQHLPGCRAYRAGGFAGRMLGAVIISTTPFLFMNTGVFC